MSGLILPGGGQVPAKPAQPSYDDLTDEQKAAVDALAEREEVEFEKVETAFVIIKTLDGAFGIRPYLPTMEPVAPQRTADENDYLSAFAIISANLHAQMAAAVTSQAMMQQAAMMQRAMADQQLHRSLKL